MLGSSPTEWTKSTSEKGSRQVEPRIAIIDALVKEPKTPKELKAEVTKQGVTRSTYHYVLRQMIKHGEVGEAKYNYKGQRVSDVVIEELLSPIGTAETPAQQIELSKNLSFLARKPGVALQPRFLSTLEELMDTQLGDLRKNALSALSDTLWNLDDTAFAEDKKARGIIRERFFTHLVNMIQNDSDLDNRGRAIRLLAELGDPEGIDHVLKVIEKASDGEYQALKNSVEQVIVWPYDPARRPRNYLTRNYHPKILIKLSRLAAEGNERASELATMIRRGAPGV
jgi:hypothetical protein